MRINKVFAAIKSKCKTKSQMRAFNALIKTFASRYFKAEDIENYASKINDAFNKNNLKFEAEGKPSKVLPKVGKVYVYPKGAKHIWNNLVAIMDAPDYIDFNEIDKNERLLKDTMINALK